MRVYYASFKGVFLGAQAVVVANDRGHAKRLIWKAIDDNKKLDKLEGTEEIELTEVNTEVASAEIINDGDY